jgi:hypothetical protein
MATITRKKLRAEIDELRDRIYRPSAAARESRAATGKARSRQQARANIARAAARRQESAMGWRVSLARLMEQTGVDKVRSKKMCKHRGSPRIIDCARAAPAQEYVEVTAYYDNGRILAYRHKSRLRVREGDE